MKRVLRIALLTTALVAAGSLAGVTGFAGADRLSASRSPHGVECGNDAVKVFQVDVGVGPRDSSREEPKPLKPRQALRRYLRQVGVRVRGRDFNLRKSGPGSRLFAHERDGETVATARVEAIGDSWYAPSIVACDRLASSEGGTR